MYADINTIYKTDNLGIDWVKIQIKDAQNNIVKLKITEIQISQDDPNIIWATLGGWEAGTKIF